MPEQANDLRVVGDINTHMPSGRCFCIVGPRQIVYRCAYGRYQRNCQQLPSIGWGRGLDGTKWIGFNFKADYTVGVKNIS